MNTIQSTGYPVHFQENAYKELNHYLETTTFSKVFILVDDNTHKDCLPNFLKQLPDDIAPVIISIKAGEINKTIDTCVEVWKSLTHLNADRKSLLINLGGGMVTDLGGFVASTFKRGIKFINIPTTLLSMVDASVGSKTGVDLGSLKNLVGVFSDPEMVLIDTSYLKTLSTRELHSGVSEIIKYGLTYDKNLWESLKQTDRFSATDLTKMIHRSVEIKNEVVLQDPRENGLRKILNFGHTIGHAIESYFLQSEDKITLTHGEAIAIGMLVEAYFSVKLFDFDASELKALKVKISELFDQVEIHEKDYAPILELMKHDKKNIGTTVNFVLLEDIGKFKLDCNATQELLLEGLNYYNS
ncbi:MAG: 3-dehydroquinate synthase [Flavobacteriaceae bacterium]|nr:3-dehydroquinate synthase [Flavobacteriaceae bacterium]